VASGKWQVASGKWQVTSDKLREFCLWAKWTNKRTNIQINLFVSIDYIF